MWTYGVPSASLRYLSAITKSDVASQRWQAYPQALASRWRGGTLGVESATFQTDSLGQFWVEFSGRVPCRAGYPSSVKCCQQE